jgi:signal transduction histidine kinase
VREAGQQTDKIALIPMPLDAQKSARTGTVVGAGELAHLIREFCWSSTSLGPISAWSKELLSLVNVILASPLPMLLYWGADLVVIYNDAARPIVSNKHPGALGSTADQVFKEAWHIIGPEVERVFSTGESVSHECVLVPLVEDGELKELYWNYSYSPVYEDGSVGGVLVVCANVTNRKVIDDALRAGAEELKRNEERLRRFIQAVSDVVYRVSADWSHALQVEGQGFLPDTHAPDPEWFTRNVHPDDQERVLAAIRKSVREGSVFELEHKVQRLDGTLGWTFSRAIPVRDEHGTVVEWLGAASDITARKQAEQALLRTEKLAVVGRLAASIAHEINNPLEAVTNLLYLAEQKADSETRSLVGLAQQELQRVSHITTNALQFNRQKVLPEAIDVVGTMQSVLDLYQGRSTQGGIRVVFEKEDCPTFHGLGGEIRQVFANLIGNALDAMKRGGTLKIRVRPSSDCGTGRSMIRITVADNGHGMSADTRTQVFKPFFTTKENTGTGLGLWISADILERHHGSIRIKSSEAGRFRGTTFSLTFPQDGHRETTAMSA